MMRSQQPSLPIPSNKETNNSEHISTPLKSNSKVPKVPIVCAPDSAMDKGSATATADQAAKKPAMVSNFTFIRHDKHNCPTALLTEK